MNRLAALLVLSALVLPGLAVAAPGDDFAADWRAWQKRRLTTLRRPYGWLALTGLHWLKPGANRIPGLPGVFEVKDGTVTLVAALEDDWSVGGRLVTRRALASDASETPDRPLNGTRAAMVISRGGQVALRVWDSESPVRKGFKGIDTFPPDPRWAITARWEAYPRPRPVEVPSVIGTTTTELAPGRAWFKVGGKEYSLEPTQDGDVVVQGRTARIALPPLEVVVELRPGETEVIGSNLDSAETAHLLELAKQAFQREVTGDRALQARARLAAEQALSALLLRVGLERVEFVEGVAAPRS